MDEKMAVVKAASENRDSHVRSDNFSAAVVPGKSTVMVAQEEGLSRVERPDDFVADDVGYRVVGEQGGLLEVEHETIRK